LESCSIGKEGVGGAKRNQNLERGKGERQNRSKFQGVSGIKAKWKGGGCEVFAGGSYNISTIRPEGKEKKR